MLDPLSTAAGVAGLIALAGTTSKSFYQFFCSIYDAPSIARELTSALYTLNIALSQIQGSLIHPNFVSVADDTQLEAIQNCLTSCTAAFDMIRTRVEASGLATSDSPVIKKAWASVKASFNEEQMQDCSRRMESEKTTLLLVVDIFSARLSADIMNQLQETKQLVQKQDRRLKDINVFCRWMIENEPGNRQGKFGPRKEKLQTTAFSLSSAYDRCDIAEMLQNSGSVLSLKLGDVKGESVDAIWEPESELGVPLRRLSSQLEFGKPSKNNEGYFQSANQVLPFSFEGFSEPLSALKRLSTRDSCGQDRVGDIVVDSLRNTFRSFGVLPYIGPVFVSYEEIHKMIRMAREVSSDIYDNLQYLERSYTMISKHWIDQRADDMLPPLLEEVNKAISNYLEWAGTVIKESKSGIKGGVESSSSVSSEVTRYSGMRRDIRLMITADPNEAERKRLMRALVNAVVQFRDLQPTLASVKMHDMQHELLTQQKQMATQLQSLLDKQQKLDDPLVAESTHQQEENAEEQDSSSAELNELDEQQNLERPLPTGHLEQEEDKAEEQDSSSAEPPEEDTTS